MTQSRFKFVAVFLVVLLAWMNSGEQSQRPLRIGTWNLEHLNEKSNTGCLKRSDADYQRLKRQIADLNVDVMAIQEVESATAAYRVFPPNDWEVIMSGRETEGERRACWGDANQRLKHQGTGFAIRKGLAIQINEPFDRLANNNPHMRWGTDITLKTDPPVRMLSVHLASGCWTKDQDADESRREVCTTLNYQMIEISKWMAERNREKQLYVILGDFNRRLAEQGDWGWKTFSMLSPKPVLATEPILTQCDPRFDSIIDHIVVPPDLAPRLLMDTLVEVPRIGQHPDHCAIHIDVGLGDR